MSTVSSTFKKFDNLLSVILYNFALLKTECILEKLYVMLKMLQQDKRVNILDLGIMYIGLNDTVKSNTPDADNIPEFVVRFTPGKTCRFEGDKLKVGGDNFL